MGMWELRTEGCAVPLARDSESGTWIGHSEVAEYFVHYHNADIDALTAERDRLAVENAEIRKSNERFRDQGKTAVSLFDELKRHQQQLAAANAAHAQLVIDYEQVLADLEKSDEVLDNLREVVPKGTRWCSDCEKMTLPDADDPDFCAECEGEDVWTRGALADVHAILYPKETTDDNG